VSVTVMKSLYGDVTKLVKICICGMQIST